LLPGEFIETGHDARYGGGGARVSMLWHHRRDRIHGIKPEPAPVWRPALGIGDAEFPRRCETDGRIARPALAGAGDRSAGLSRRSLRLRHYAAHASRADR